MSELTPDYSKRDCSLPSGCKDLIDVLKLEDTLQAKKSPPAKSNDASAAANLRRMVVRGKQLGLEVEIAELIPWNNGYPTFAPKILALNRLIHEIGRTRHVRVLPFYSVLADPGRPGRTKDTWTAEGDHPSVLGYRRLGELAFRLP